MADTADKVTDRHVVLFESFTALQAEYDHLKNEHDALLKQIGCDNAEDGVKGIRGLQERVRFTKDYETLKSNLTALRIAIDRYDSDVAGLVISQDRFVWERVRAILDAARRLCEISRE